MKFAKYIIGVLFLIATSLSLKAQTDIYWVGDTGSWNNPNKWFKDAEGLNPAGIIPGPNSIVHFTDYSGSSSQIWDVNINPGSYNVHSILVETDIKFNINLNGIDGNEVDISVIGDLLFRPTVELQYGSSFILNNKWLFISANTHNITSAGLDLFNIEIKNESGVFNQLDNIVVSGQIRMFAGIWNSNSKSVTTGKLLFEDNESSSAPLTKVFNTGSSTISCEHWESGFTYGSLLVNGNHTIRTNIFRGSPQQSNDPPFHYNNIVLLELDDVSNGTPIEYNNFECRSCILENLTIEDTGDTKLADEFTINKDFTIVNHGSSILFNGGNSRDSEATFNGNIIVPQKLDCTDPFTIFSSIHTDESIFIRANGELNIKDAIIINIQTQTNSGAEFNLVGGILQGASSGWNIESAPLSYDFFWRPPAQTTGDWDEPSNWQNEAGLSCLPSLADNVYIDASTKGSMRIPANINAQCKDFIWSNKDGYELILSGTNTQESLLSISGNFDIEEGVIITPVMRHEINFTSTSNNYILSRGVELPELLFTGTKGSWTLLEDLDADILTFEGGTFKTNDRDVITDIWNSFEEYPKHFEFKSSEIRVNGVMDLAEFQTRNVTVDAGTSTIKCEALNSVVTDLYNVQLNNSNTYTLNNEAYNFNSLRLNGTGEVRAVNNLTLNNLLFQKNGSSLSFDPQDVLEINTRIISPTNVTGQLKSKTPGTQANVNRPTGNLCVDGTVEFLDISSNMTGVFHAPNGIDIGNNTDIIFDDGIGSNTLYWIAESGGQWNQKSNWSQTDGGCPSDKDPSNTLNLEFNSNSFTNSPVTVSVPVSEIANNVTFKNSENLNVNIITILSIENLDIESGFVNFQGKTLDVSGTTKINSSGFLTTDMVNFITDFLVTLSGAYIVRSGSNALIRN